MKIGELKAGGWDYAYNPNQIWFKQESPWSWWFCHSMEDIRTAVLVDVRNYSLDKIETIINSYGYSLLYFCEPNKETIFEMYPATYIYVIAECIYECEFASLTP